MKKKCTRAAENHLMDWWIRVKQKIIPVTKWNEKNKCVSSQFVFLNDISNRWRMKIQRYLLPYWC